MKLKQSTLDAALKGTTALKAGRHSDGRNLYLNVSGTGAMSWIFLYTDNTGKRREAGIGSFTGAGKSARVTLSQARLAADTIRVQLASPGFDLLADRKRARLSGTTFLTVMTDTIAVEKKQGGWKVRDGVCASEIEWTDSLRLHARDLLSMPVAAIDTAAVLKVLKPIWSTIPQTAEKVRFRIEKILGRAKAEGMRDGDNPAAYKGHLDAHLGRKAKKQKGTGISHAALPHAEAGALLARLAAQKGNAAQALAFTMLTAVRTNETLDMVWSEVDLDKAEWTIPAERMKAGVKHIVPLSSAALELLARLPKVVGNDYVFAGSKAGKPLGATALEDKLCDAPAKGGMGYRGQATVHGMRSTFSDWVGDETTFTKEDREHCLAHQLDAVEGAYRRSTAVEKRRQIMQAWADYLEGKAGQNVVHLAA